MADEFADAFASSFCKVVKNSDHQLTIRKVYEVVFSVRFRTKSKVHLDCDEIRSLIDHIISLIDHEPPNLRVANKLLQDVEKINKDFTSVRMKEFQLRKKVICDNIYATLEDLRLNPIKNSTPVKVSFYD